MGGDLGQGEVETAFRSRRSAYHHDYGESATKRNTEANQQRPLQGWTGKDGLDLGELREKVEV